MAVEETRALVARYFEAFNAGSIAGMVACLTDDVVHDVNQGGRRIGRDAFERFSIHMARCYRETLGDMVIFVSEDGTRAAAEYTARGSYLDSDDSLPAATGQRYSLPGGTFFAIEDDRIARVTTYYNLEELIAQLSKA